MTILRGAEDMERRRNKTVGVDDQLAAKSLCFIEQRASYQLMLLIRKLAGR